MTRMMVGGKIYENREEYLQSQGTKRKESKDSPPPPGRPQYAAKKLPTYESKSLYTADPILTLMAMMNSKGGVGKTTTSANMAFQLAHDLPEKDNVLLVEADTQCNLQPLFRPAHSFEKKDDQNESAIMDDERNPEEHGYETPKCQFTQDGNFELLKKGTYKYADNIITAKVEDQEAARTTLYEAYFMRITEEDTAQMPTTISLRKTRTAGSKVFLLPGSPNIKKMEQELLDADNAQYGKGQRLLGVFRNLIVDTMKETKCTFAILDFGPHVGFLNQVMVMSCDLIIPPTFADELSVQSSSAFLGKTLPSWYAWYTQKIMSDRNKYKDPVDRVTPRYHLKTMLPFILPFTVSNFATAKSNVQRAQASWIKALENLKSSDEVVASYQITLDNKHAFMLCQTERVLLDAGITEGLALVELDKIPSKNNTPAKRIILETIREQYEIYVNFIMTVAGLSG